MHGLFRLSDDDLHRLFIQAKHTGATATAYRVWCERLDREARRAEHEREAA